MRYRNLGKSGIEASVIGFGAWAIGGWMWGGTDDDQAIRAIRAGLDEGMNLIDTAPVYGMGHSEIVVGKAIAGRRDQVVLATKCGLIWHDEKGQFYFNTDEQKVSPKASKMKVYKYLGADSIRYEIEQSLKRLETDHIDLYQTHWQEETTPISERMETLLKLKDEGKIRAIGSSNCSLDQLQEYRRLGQLDSEQARYNMLDRRLDAEILPFCADHDIAVLAYCPMEQGLLTGRVKVDRVFPDGDLRRNSQLFSVENRQRVLDLLKEFEPICETHGISPAQLALAWAVAQRGCTHALAGARNEAQAKENAAAGDVALSDAELQQITDAVNAFSFAK